MKLIKCGSDLKKEYYDDTESINNTLIKDYYRFRRVSNKDPNSKELAIGSAFDALIEDHINGTNFFDEEIIVLDVKSRNTKKYKDTLEEQNLIPNENDRKKIILKQEFDEIMKVEDEFVIAPNLFPQGKLLGDLEEVNIQYAIFWEDRGYKFKCLIDLLFIHNNELYIYDLKTTSRELEDFKYQFKSLKYWIQDIHYSQGSSLLKDHFNVNKVHKMKFITFPLKFPYYPKVFSIEDKRRDNLFSKYVDILKDLISWDRGGRKKDYQEEEELEIYE